MMCVCWQAKRCKDDLDDEALARVEDALDNLDEFIKYKTGK